MGREKWLSLSKTNRFLKGFHHIGSHTDVLSGFLEELIKGESIAAFWISGRPLMCSAHVMTKGSCSSDRFGVENVYCMSQCQEKLML